MNEVWMNERDKDLNIVNQVPSWHVSWSNKFIYHHYIPYSTWYHRNIAV